MSEFHQYALYFALIIGSLCAVGVSVYGAVRCFQMRVYLAGLVCLAVMPCWLGVNAVLTIVLYAIATPNSRTPNNLAEYLVAPIYAANAGLVCYALLSFVKRFVRSKNETLLATEYGSSPGDTEDELLHSQSGVRTYLENITLPKKKIAGFVFVALGALGMSSWFFPAGVLFVMIGVSLIVEVQLWRR